MSVKVICETIDLATGKVEGKRLVDHDNPEHREWMGRHAYWAMRSGKKFVTYPKTAGRKKDAEDDDE
jgi:hypothetical protein